MEHGKGGLRSPRAAGILTGPGLTVKQANRLRRPRQFQRVRREGQRYHHPLLRLNIAPERHRRTRCGFVVSKRFGNAVQRNRAKRRVREAVRLMLDHVTPGVDMVFVLRTPRLLEVPFATILAAVQELLQQAGVWDDTRKEKEAKTEKA